MQRMGLSREDNDGTAGGGGGGSGEDTSSSNGGVGETPLSRVETRSGFWIIMIQEKLNTLIGGKKIIQGW